MTPLALLDQLLEDVAEQQAMPDDSWRHQYAEIRRALAALAPEGATPAPDAITIDVLDDTPADPMFMEDAADCSGCKQKHHHCTCIAAAAPAPAAGEAERLAIEVRANWQNYLLRYPSGWSQEAARIEEFIADIDRLLAALTPKGGA